MQLILIYIKKFFLSKRYEWLKFDSVFMYLGIIISVAALVTTFIIFEGYETTLKRTILGVNSHIYFFRNGVNDLSFEDYQRVSEFLQTKEEVNTFNGVVSGQAIASFGDRAKGSFIKSVDWQSRNLASIYHDAVIEGSYELLNDNDVVVGKFLALMLGVGIGDEIRLMSTSSATAGIAGIRFQTKTMRIVGIFYSGMYEYDSRFIFLNIETARQFDAGDSYYTMVEVQLKEEYISRAMDIALTWQRDFRNQFQVLSWEFFNSNLFAMLSLQKWVLTIILSFLIVVAGFNVITTTFASILEKRKEIGLLKTIGLSGRKIAIIFLVQISLIATVCIVVGIFTGIGFGYLISYQTMISLRGEVYFLDRIHIYVDFLKMAMIFFIAFTIIILSSIIPIRTISKMREIEILRYRK